MGQSINLSSVQEVFWMNDWTWHLFQITFITQQERLSHPIGWKLMGCNPHAHSVSTTFRWLFHKELYKCHMDKTQLPLYTRLPESCRSLLESMCSIWKLITGILPFVVHPGERGLWKKHRFYIHKRQNTLAVLVGSYSFVNYAQTKTASCVTYSRGGLFCLPVNATAGVTKDKKNTHSRLNEDSIGYLPGL